MSSEESRSFLGKFDETNDKERARNRGDSNRPWLIILGTVNIILLMICLFLSLALLRRGTYGEMSNRLPVGDGTLAMPYSPANEIIEYEYRVMEKNDTRFTGYPSVEWEENMSTLMAGTLIRFSEAEIDLHGIGSIALDDGGFAGGIGVAHQLHCVKKLKQMLYASYFFPELDPHGEEMEERREHADHCLDWIRQSVMCYVDPTMYTFVWDGEGRARHHAPGTQKCVNWDKLHGWMHSRVANRSMFVES